MKAFSPGLTEPELMRRRWAGARRKRGAERRICRCGNMMCLDAVGIRRYRGERSVVVCWGKSGIVEQRNEVLESRYFRLELFRANPSSALSQPCLSGAPNYRQCTCLREPASRDATSCTDATRVGKSHYQTRVAVQSRISRGRHCHRLGAPEILRPIDTHFVLLGLPVVFPV